MVLAKTPCGFTIDLTEKREARKGEALWLGLALMELCVHRVEGVHVCLKSCALFWRELWFKVFLVIILEYLREHVCNGLAIWVSHRIDSSVCAFSHELML